MTVSQVSLADDHRSSWRGEDRTTKGDIKYISSDEEVKETARQILVDDGKETM